MTDRAACPTCGARLCIVCGENSPASLTGDRCAGCRSIARKTWTAKEDSLIRRVYSELYIRGIVKALAKHLGRSRAGVTERAGDLGVSRRRGTGAPAGECHACGNGTGNNPALDIRGRGLYVLCQSCAAILADDVSEDELEAAARHYERRAFA